LSGYALTDLVLKFQFGLHKIALCSSQRQADATFAELAREPGAGLMVVPDIWLAANRGQIVGLAAKHRLPAIYPTRQYSPDLISYGPDTPDLFRRAAAYVDRTLEGTKPADLPVQAPTNYELVINRKTAKALGLAIPDKLLAIADEVIE
jgi:putative ABC transport system substrate-binding protein